MLVKSFFKSNVLMSLFVTLLPDLIDIWIFVVYSFDISRGSTLYLYTFVLVYLYTCILVYLYTYVIVYLFIIEIVFSCA